jgi:hypothetical protein
MILTIDFLREPFQNTLATSSSSGLGGQGVWCVTNGITDSDGQTAKEKCTCFTCMRQYPRPRHSLNAECRPDMTEKEKSNMAYVLEPTIPNDDLPRIIADAQTHPKLGVRISRLFSDGPTHHRWAVDRQNDSYLIGCLHDFKCYREGFMFFYRGNAYTVFVNKTTSKQVRNCVVGWVSLDSQFKSPPPEDPDFRRALSEAREMFYSDVPRSRLVFDLKQQEGK